MSPDTLDDKRRADILLAFDVGRKKTGIAIGNRLTEGARPLAIVHGDSARQLQSIGDYINEWRPGELLVGLPKHMDDTEHRMTAHCRRFADRLRERFALPVTLCDERLTTCGVIGDAAKSRPLDADAAALLLQGWLDGARRRERQNETTHD